VAPTTVDVEIENLNLDTFFASMGKKLASPSTKTGRCDAWQKMKNTDYKASVALGFLSEMREMCRLRDMPHPLECARAIIHAPNSKTSSQFVSALLGVELPRSIVSFLLSYDVTLSRLMKSPENCFLGMFCRFV
jgi:hypothetical protein